MQTQQNPIISSSKRYIQQKQKGRGGRHTGTSVAAAAGTIDPLTAPAAVAAPVALASAADAAPSCMRDRLRSSYEPITGMTSGSANSDVCRAAKRTCTHACHALKCSAEEGRPDKHTDLTQNFWAPESDT